MNKTKIPLVPLSCKDWFQAWQGQIEMYLSRNAALCREPSRVKFNFYNFNTHLEMVAATATTLFFSFRPPTDPKISGLLKQQVELKGFGRTRFARFCRPER